MGGIYSSRKYIAQRLSYLQAIMEFNKEDALNKLKPSSLPGGVGIMSLNRGGVQEVNSGERRANLLELLNPFFRREREKEREQ